MTPQTTTSETFPKLEASQQIMTNTYIPERAMFIYAHPDDIEFGVAGTAALWAKNGSDVTYVVITDGNVGSNEAGMTAEKLAEIRRAEQTAAAEVVGASCIFLGYHDGLLEATMELTKELVRLIRIHKPNFFGQFKDILLLQ